jgi:hypothetical protein
VKYNPVVYDLVDGKPKRKPIEAAKKLLADAGYRAGATRRPASRSSSTTTRRASARLQVAHRLDRQAVREAQHPARGRDTDYNRFQDKMRKGSAQLFFWGWQADYPDPENFLFLLYGPELQGQGRRRKRRELRQPEFDKLFERMKDLDDTAERRELIKKMIEILQQDAVWLWGWTDEFSGAYQQWLSTASRRTSSATSCSTCGSIRRCVCGLVDQWNSANPIPLIVVLLLFLIAAWPGVARVEAAPERNRDRRRNARRGWR